MISIQKKRGRKSLQDQDFSSDGRRKSYTRFMFKKDATNQLNGTKKVHVLQMSKNTVP